MKVNITYPTVGIQRHIRMKLIKIFKWLFLLAGIVCGVVNYLTGGKAWSIVVIWSMWMAWSQIVSTDMVEYNRISQTVKFIMNACILLALIDLLLAPGWSVNVIAIVCFSALILVAILFFSDYDVQSQNMYPMLMFCMFCLIGAGIGIYVRKRTGGLYWPLIVLGAVALGLLALCILRLGRNFIVEVKKRFSVR